MAQRTISTGGMSSTYQSTIDTLKINMASGKKIYAADVNSLISVWNSFAGHYHGITDRYGIKDYGDAGYNGAGNYSSSGNYENDSSSGPIGLNGGIASVTQGGSITAAKHNELRSAVAGGLNHYHSWNDRTS